MAKNLTKREREILVIILNGESRKNVIAKKLGISICTVVKHLKNMRRKFKVASTLDLVLKFLQQPTNIIKKLEDTQTK